MPWPAIFRHRLPGIIEDVFSATQPLWNQASDPAMLPPTQVRDVTGFPRAPE